MWNWLKKVTPLGRIEKGVQSYIDRPRPVERGTITVGHRRIYVPPTWSGVLFTGTLLAMLLTAMNYNMSLGYGFTFLLSGLGVVSLFHAYRNLLGLRVTPVRADPVFAGDFATYQLAIENPRQRRPGLRLITRDGQDQFDIAMQTQVVRSIVRRSTQRGWFPLGRVVLETYYPLGLIRAMTVIRPDSQCLVYPQPEQSPPPLPVSGGWGRGYHAGADGQDDFAGLRDHRPADPPKHIAWKALARGGTLLTKQFEGAQAGEVVIDWSVTMELKDVEARLSRMTAWLLEAQAQGLTYGLILPNAHVPSGQGPAHFANCMALVATFGLGEPR